jgi:hypothetical protein
MTAQIYNNISRKLVTRLEPSEKVNRICKTLLVNELRWN